MYIRTPSSVEVSAERDAAAGSWTWSRALGIVALHLLLTAPPLAGQEPDTLQVDRDVGYAWTMQDGRTEYGLDVYARPGLDGAPVVISLHGGSGSKDAAPYVEVSRRLAAEGLAVLNVTYPGGSPAGYLESDGASLRSALETVLCALRFVGARAPEYGGDPGNVIVLGHSAGGYMGLMVSLLRDSLRGRWNAFASDRGGDSGGGSVECAVEDAAPAPTGFVGFNGAYFVFHFAGLPERDAALWALLDPREYRTLQPSLKTRFILGSQDSTQPAAHLEMVRQFSSDRVGAGSDSEVVEVTADHGYSFEPAAWNRTLETIQGLARRRPIP